MREDRNTRPERWLFDGLVTSQAVREVLPLLTGFRGTGLFQADLEPTGTVSFVAGRNSTEWPERRLRTRRVNCA